MSLSRTRHSGYSGDVDGVEIRVVPRGVIERPGQRRQPGQIPPLGTTFAPHFTAADVRRAGDELRDLMPNSWGFEDTARRMLRAVFPNATFEDDSRG